MDIASGPRRMATGLAACLFLTAALAAAEPVRVLNAETTANTQIRLDSPGVNIFVHDLNEVFLTGTFADDGFIFRPDGTANTTLAAEIVRYNPPEDVVVYARLLSELQPGDPDRDVFAETMIRFRWRIVAAEREESDRILPGITDPTVRGLIRGVDEQFQELDRERAEVRENARMLANEVFQWVRRQTRRLDRETGRK